MTITENTSNELGGACDVTLTLSDDAGTCYNSDFADTTDDTKAACENYVYLNNANWGGTFYTGCYNMHTHVFNPTTSQAECEAYSFTGENADADPYVVSFSVSPVNDAPVVLDWDVTSGAVVTAANGSTPVAPWSISLMEDDTNVENLTYDLSAVKYDVDHLDADLTWTVESTDQCTYENYFSTEIVGDNLVFTLVPDATTTANAWEIDYLNDNGIHQIGPSGSDFCQIRLVLKDTATAPSYVPNYDPSVMPIASYQQGVATQEIGVRVENVRELVADYSFDETTGFDFQGITDVLTGTYVPVEVDVSAGGDQGPYTYDHMLAVTFHTSGGHGEAENVMYVTPPEWGETMTIKEYVYIVDDGQSTPYIWVEMDVLTCLDAECDLSKSPAQRFQTDDPSSHINYGGGVVGDQWSKPGAYGDDGMKESQRRPLLQDSNWCNLSLIHI